MPTTVRVAAAACAVLVSTLAPVGTDVPVGGAERAGAAPAATCTQDWRPATTATYLDADGRPSDPPRPLAPAPGPTHRPFHVFCDGRYVSTVWLGTPVNLHEALRAAAELTAHAVYPTARLAANPSVGITGLASWFWAVPDANPVRMLPGNGPGVELELRVASVRWSFGDGSPVAPSGLGAPFPTPSSIAHTYERKGTYPVTGQVVVTGTFWYEELTDDLPGGPHPVALSHPVAEIRSLLHSS